MVKVNSSLFIAAIFSLCVVLSQNTNSHAEKTTPQGTIRGHVTDAETKVPLPGASIILLDTKLGAMADTEGNFVIGGVPVGGYTVRFTLLGYEPLSQTDIIVRSNRTTFLEAELTISFLELKGVTVTSGYFSQTEEQPTSAINFSSEEIRKGTRLGRGCQPDHPGASQPG
jgi:hypothetical protein